MESKTAAVVFALASTAAAVVVGAGSYIIGGREYLKLVGIGLIFGYGIVIHYARRMAARGFRRPRENWLDRRRDD